LGINISRELTREQRLPEERLFQAIILQAFEDALSIGEMKQDAYAKQDSFNWFSTISDDFDTVCWFANFDPEIIRNKFNELVRNKTIHYTKKQLKWLRYRFLYKQYREVKTKQERRQILKEIKEIEGLKKEKRIVKVE
jgi:tRNA A37 N6-isopentenylltransferase MiaA